MEIALATRNADKAREVRGILGADSPFRLRTLDELGVDFASDEDRIEAFHTFRDNADAKARYFARKTGIPALADDSGLAVDALEGAPGVHSKRFSGRDDLAGVALDQENNRLLLERLQDVAPAQRTAHYVCAASLALPSRSILTVIGTCAGVIATEPRGDGGFGYDPLFLLPDRGVTFAEAAPELKRRRSHRARAFRALAAHLSDFLQG